MRDFEAFCGGAYPRLVAAFTHQFGDVWLAEELAQEALIRAGLRWTRVAQLDAPEGWAFRVGCNLGVSAMRRRSLERRVMRRRTDDASIHLDPDAADGLTLQAAMETLPDMQRRAVIARYYLGLSGEQAAEALGTTAGNVRVLTHRALERLRAQLGTNLEEAVDVH